MDHSLNDKTLEIMIRLTVVDEYVHEPIPYNTTNDMLVWKLKLIWAPYYPNNKPPVLMIQPMDQQLPLGKMYKFKLTPSDFSDDTVSIKIQCDLISPSFLNIKQEQDLSTVATFYPTMEKEIGDWTVTIKLKDKRKVDESG